MNVNLTNWHETETCTWCEREKECVTAGFADGFIKASPMCWKCLAKAVKVRYRQESKTATDAVRDRYVESK